MEKKPAHLFPSIAQRRREKSALEWDPGATGADFTDAEIDSFRQTLLHEETLHCPHCGSLMAAERTDSSSDEVVWSVVCHTCDAHVAVRAFPNRAPRAPRFNTLIVSAPEGNRLKKMVPNSLWSMTVHGVLIYLAVLATAGGAELIQDTQDTSLVYLVLEDDKPDEAEPEPEPEEAPAQVIALNAPAKGFQTVTAPIDIPTEIPPVDLSQQFDPRDFSGEGVEGGIFAGVEGGTALTTQDRATFTFREAAVDEPPERISGPPLRYPEMLRQANIEGSVLLEFVVDTSGTVERESVKIIRATHDAFVSHATEAVVKSQYRPGRVRGLAVRVLVQQNERLTPRSVAPTAHLASAGCVVWRSDLPARLRGRR